MAKTNEASPLKILSTILSELIERSNKRRTPFFENNFNPDIRQLQAALTALSSDRNLEEQNFNEITNQINEIIDYLGDKPDQDKNVDDCRNKLTLCRNKIAPIIIALDEKAKKPNPIYRYFSNLFLVFNYKLVTRPGSEKDNHDIDLIAYRATVASLFFSDTEIDLPTPKNKRNIREYRPTIFATGIPSTAPPSEDSALRKRLIIKHTGGDSQLRSPLKLANPISWVIARPLAWLVHSINKSLRPKDDEAPSRIKTALRYLATYSLVIPFTIAVVPVVLISAASAAGRGVANLFGIIKRKITGAKPKEKEHKTIDDQTWKNILEEEKAIIARENEKQKKEEDNKQKKLLAQQKRQSLYTSQTDPLDVSASNEPLLEESEESPLIQEQRKTKFSFFRKFLTFFQPNKKEVPTNVFDDRNDFNPPAAPTTSKSSSFFNFFSSAKPRKPNNPIYVLPAVYEGSNYMEAIAAKDQLLVNQDKAAKAPAAISQQTPPTSRSASLTDILPIRVIPINVVKHERTLIETVTIQRHDSDKQSAKSEFYFQKNDLKKLTGMAAMEWAARNVESFLEIMPNKNQPLKIIAGNMTPACIEALIVYCKYKNLQYIPPREFKKSISDAKVEAFEKKWLKMHPVDSSTNSLTQSVQSSNQIN